MPRQTLIQRSRRVPPAEKATFHQITGAGRRKVIREFFGVSRQDEDAIHQRLDDAISRNVQR
jgi:hypothetical protein